MARRGSILLVTGVGCGLAAIGACDITGPDSPAVFLDPPSLTLEDGQSAKISAKLRNPRARTVVWSSSNSGVATVDPTGKVTGIVNGSATITAKMTDDTTVTASIPVTVSGPAVATIAVSPAVVTVHVGLAFRMAVQLRAADGRIIRGRRITWTSPDTRIAEVTAQGIVRGRAPGGPIDLVASIEGQTATARVRVAHAAELCPVITPRLFAEIRENHPRIELKIAYAYDHKTRPPSPEIKKGDSPYKASISLASSIFGYAMGQQAAGWLEGKSIPQAMDILPRALTSSNIADYERDTADPGAVYADPARRSSYLKMYGNICFDTRENYINFPWSSETK